MKKKEKERKRIEREERKKVKEAAKMKGAEITQHHSLIIEICKHTLLCAQYVRMLWYACWHWQPKKQAADPAPTTQQFSTKEVCLHTRRKEEGYDLPDQQYRLRLAIGTDTAGSTFVAASSSQPAANNDSLSYSEQSDCQTGQCGHPKVRKWVQCNHCLRWCHCLCTGIAHKCTKEKMYKCPACTQS